MAAESWFSSAECRSNRSLFLRSSCSDCAFSAVSAASRLASVSRATASSPLKSTSFLWASSASWIISSSLTWACSTDCRKKSLSSTATSSWSFRSSHWAASTAKASCTLLSSATFSCSLAVSCDLHRCTVSSAAARCPRSCSNSSSSSWDCFWTSASSRRLSSSCASRRAVWSANCFAAVSCLSICVCMLSIRAFCCSSKLAICCSIAARRATSRCEADCSLSDSARIRAQSTSMALVCSSSDD
mmetsp:Transcript_38445/g.81157  ORF Transcript_38445/g.81157 Transcript_38445/m.81157 type:complete len:244 (-) Transcript_38445:289-1020(-)